MNRRGFLKSLFAGTVMLAVPKVLLVIPPLLKTEAEAIVELPPPIDTKHLDIREQAKKNLMKWYSDAVDKCMYEALIA